MKKDDFFFQYQYDYELDARLKKRQGWMISWQVDFLQLLREW